jgi:hypothetical protein
MEERTSALLAAHTDPLILDLRYVKINNSAGFVLKVILSVMSKNIWSFFFLMKNICPAMFSKQEHLELRTDSLDILSCLLHAKTHIVAQMASDRTKSPYPLRCFC